MRRALAIFTALAVVLALATPAAAKGKPKPPKPPTAGMTCEESGYPDAPVGGTQSLNFHLTAENREGCIDWTPTEGTWQVVVTTGTARSVAFSVKDSVPGDSTHCVDYTRTSEGGVWTIELRKAHGSDSWIDRCGDTFSDSSEPLAFQVFSQWKGKSSGGEPATVTVTFVPPAP